MDFDDTPEEATFRAEARDFLVAHARRKTSESRRHPLHHDGSADADAEHVRRCRAWQGTLFEHGWAGITWPEEYGGRGGTATQQAQFDEEQAAFDVSTGVFAVGIGMVGPTLIAHGTDEHKARYLQPLLRGKEIWCQLFSEPGAGSDLAGLSTRAARNGDEWLVSGQKVWTTGAHHSEMAILLARTDSSVSKHRGITYFLVDMATPGIEVRPLRQINRAAHFNEVFLTDVRVPASNVVGEVNGGWTVARTTLANERSLIGGGVGAQLGGFSQVVELARRMSQDGDPVARQSLAAMYMRAQILRYLGMRARTEASHGRPPGPESSVMKLAYSRHVAATADLVLALEQAEGTLIDDAAVDGGFWQQQFLTQWASRIGGGTDEIQRNVIGERVLGLPAELRLDRDVPFSTLARA